MDHYIFFPEDGNSRMYAALEGDTMHVNAILSGPKAGTCEQYPLRKYVRQGDEGGNEVFLVAYEIQPSNDEIEQAILRLKLPPIKTYPKDN